MSDSAVIPHNFRGQKIPPSATLQQIDAAYEDENGKIVIARLQTIIVEQPGTAPAPPRVRIPDPSPEREERSTLCLCMIAVLQAIIWLIGVIVAIVVFVVRCVLLMVCAILGANNDD